MAPKRINGEVTHKESRNPALNRERILAAARQLFASQGVAETSMNQIAQAAHVGPGTLYRHFANKGQLCVVLLTDSFTTFQARVAGIIDDANVPASGLVQLERFLDEIIDLTATHIPLLTAIEEGGGSGRIHAYQGPVHTWAHRQLVGLLTTAIQLGEVSNVDAEFTADAILAALAPSLLVFQQQQRGFSQERIAQGLRRVFIEGLQRSPSTTKKRKR